MMASRTLAQYYTLRAEAADAFAVAHNLESQAVLLDPLKPRAAQDAAFSTALVHRDTWLNRAREFRALAVQA